MRIQPITPFSIYNLKNQNSKPQVKTQNNAYNPVAYNDLTFTARLFRSPEDFYSQPFNKNGMPETMKQYLNADYEDRQHMPPQQMLKLVFGDINETKNLEQVKRHFSDEPLFKNLTDKPNKNARTGILAEIDVMREENKPLFKNGKDNLGHYILKKIYLEGKTLKEINEDFKKDISVHYSGLSDITYDTTAAFGIKFPNNAFWKSFTHNRDNFKYVHKPRKPFIREGAVQKQSSTVVTKQRKRFEGVKDWEIDRLSDALVKGGGNLDETRKQLKKSSVRDEASLNFVAKYMSEINSVVLEKLHVSPEMREFFENSDNLSKSQKQKMEAYWQDSERRDLRSIIMKDTIKLFFDAYGVDGQNDDFKELLDYAHGIKPARLAQMKEHDRIQAEYDEMFAQLDEKEAVQEKTVEPKSVDEILDEVVKTENANVYEFDIDDNTVKLVGNLQEALEDSLKNETSFLPKAYANKYVNFVMDKYKNNDAFILSKILSDKGFKLPEDDRLMSEDEFKNANLDLYQDFNDIDIVDTRAAQQAVIEGFARNNAVRTSLKKQLFELGVFECVSFAKLLPDNITNSIKADKTFINAKYNEYKRPLSDAEARKIGIQIINLMKNYNPNDSIVANNRNFKKLSPLYYSISKFLNNKDLNKNNFRELITSYVKEYGGSARFFIDKNVTEEMKMGKMEHFFVDLYFENASLLASYATLDEDGMKYIRLHDYELYQNLLHEYGSHLDFKKTGF